MTEVIRILLVEDDEDDYVLTKSLLAKADGVQYRLDWVKSFDEALADILQARHDVYLLDYRLSAASGLELMRRAIQAGISAPMILLTGQGDREDDLEAMRSGAADFLNKHQLDASMLERSIRYAISHRRSENALRQLRDELEHRVAQRTAELAATNKELRSSLREKDALLREVHHRVKNNLQVIHSLLNLQAECTVDEAVRRMFRDSQNRIRTMALIHESLYRSGNLAAIDFATYLENLVTMVLRCYGATPESIQCQNAADNVALEVETAIPCALLVNELLSNSLKHAFLPGQHGIVRVGFRRDNTTSLILSVEDNGIGSSASKGEAASATLGLELIQALVDQLQGTIEWRAENGTKVTITFAEPIRERELP